MLMLTNASISKLNKKLPALPTLDHLQCRMQEKLRESNRRGGVCHRRHGRTDNFSLRSIYVSALRVQNLHVSTLVKNPSGWCAIYDSRWE